MGWEALDYGIVQIELRHHVGQCVHALELGRATHAALWSAACQADAGAARLDLALDLAAGSEGAIELRLQHSAAFSEASTRRMAAHFLARRMLHEQSLQGCNQMSSTARGVTTRMHCALSAASLPWGRGPGRARLLWWLRVIACMQRRGLTLRSGCAGPPQGRSGCARGLHGQDRDSRRG
jgi:hypothetical protein